MQDITINSEPVELYKILKFQGLASSGGEAKQLVASGKVRVNGQLETRKRKQMCAGDTLEFNGEVYRLIF